MVNNKAASLLLALFLLLAGIVAVLLFFPFKWKPGSPLAKDRVIIAVIYYDKAEASTYSAAHETGIKQMQMEIGLADQQILRRFNINDSELVHVEHTMRKCIDDGANVIIATSWGYMDTCEKLAKEYPSVIFAHASGYKYNSTNFTNYFGKVYQPRYLSGIVAGMKTETGKIGYVAAMGLDNSEVTGNINAFALGVESVNPNARITVYVTNSWYDAAEERRGADSLIAYGCDVIAQHCNTPEPQRRAEKAGVWGIGYNTDMSTEAPGAVLASVVWNWGTYYSRLIRSIIDGSFTTEPYKGGMREGMVDMTQPSIRLTGVETRDEVAKARARILGGNFSIFEGAMTTANGRTVGKPGAAWSEEEISSGMNWYYHNVDVKTKEQMTGKQ